MNWATSREKIPKPDTVLDVPHCLGLPKKVPIPKTRISLHLMTTPDLLCDTITLSFSHIQRETGCVCLSAIARTPPAHTSHPRMNFQPQQLDLFGISRMYLVCISLECFFCGSHAALLEPQRWTVLQEQSQHHPSGFPELNFEDNKISPPGNERALRRVCYLCFCFLSPLTFTPRAGSSLQPSPLRASTFSA